MATTLRLPMQPDVSRTQTLGGNAWWTSLALSNRDAGAFAFKNGVDGKAYWKLNVPSNINATPNLGIVLRCYRLGTAASNVVLNVSGGQYANGASVDPTLTASTPQTVAAPTTAKQAFEVTFTASLPTPTADDEYIVEVFRTGSSGSDTLSETLYIERVMFKCDF